MHFPPAVTCLHNVTSSKNWREVICYGVATSHHIVTVYNFVEFISKTEVFVVCDVGI